MISEIQISDADKSAINWWKKVPWLEDKNRIEFSSGLNIIFGPNGSGKSTVLSLLAKMLHCEQGGVSTVTRNSVSDLFKYSSKGLKKDDDLAVAQVEYKDGIRPIHDGQAVFYIDSGKKIGIYGGGAFDDDFFSEGIRNTVLKGSSGQHTLDKLTPVMNCVYQKSEWPEIKWNMIPDRVNSLWRARLQIVAQELSGSISIGQPTILLDEPDRSLDVPTQALLWRRLNEFSRYFQIIVASHSLFSINIHNANYIETEFGYLNKCRDILTNV